jgi:hypothetical protein
VGLASPIRQLSGRGIEVKTWEPWSPFSASQWCLNEKGHDGVRIALVTTAVGALLVGCGSSVVVDGQPVNHPYDGPMQLKQDFSDNATALEKSGAAGRALECEGKPYEGGAGDYVDGGLESVQDSPAEALENWLDNEWSDLPGTGYRVERDDGHRVLLSYDVDKRTKIAFITADGLRDYNHHTGWGVESWAMCDPSELPEVAEAMGIDVWEDATGARVPVTVISSFQGAEHCDWQDITFLVLGSDRDSDEYVRDTEGELRELLRSRYDPDASLPKGAINTGYHLDGRRLWLGPERDAAYLVSLQNRTDVERWPAAKKQIGCA